MPSFILTSINGENCDIPYKYNTKFVDELSSILSVNCLQFCRRTVFKMRVGELSCRWTVSIPKYHTLFVIFEKAAKFEIVVCCKL